MFSTLECLKSTMRTFWAQFEELGVKTKHFGKILQICLIFQIHFGKTKLSTNWYHRMWGERVWLWRMCLLCVGMLFSSLRWFWLFKIWHNIYCRVLHFKFSMFCGKLVNYFSLHCGKLWTNSTISSADKFPNSSDFKTQYFGVKAQLSHGNLYSSTQWNWTLNLQRYHWDIIFITVVGVCANIQNCYDC